MRRFEKQMSPSTTESRVGLETISKIVLQCLVAALEGK